MVGGAWVVFRSRRRRRNKAKEEEGAAGEPGRMAAEVDGKSAAAAEHRPELEANQAPVEMGGGHDRGAGLVELDGGQRG